jgi:hypothetical protein
MRADILGMRIPRIYTALLLACLGLALPCGLAAQATAPQGQKTAAGTPATAPSAAPPAAAGKSGQGAAAAGDKTGLPAEFRGIKLGMGMEEVEAILGTDPIFAWRGPDDVSLLPARNQSLIETSGTSFVKRAFFQFVDGKLWIIIVFLNPDRIDHYTIYSQLVAKYGEPILLSPKEVRWEDKASRMALERPLTLRYMDMAVFSKLQEAGEAKAGSEEMDRQAFLEGL